MSFVSNEEKQQNNYVQFGKLVKQAHHHYDEPNLSFLKPNQKNETKVKGIEKGCKVKQSHRPECCMF